MSPALYNAMLFFGPAICFIAAAIAVVFVIKAITDDDSDINPDGC